MQTLCVCFDGICIWWNRADDICDCFPACRDGPNEKQMVAAKVECDLICDREMFEAQVVRFNRSKANSETSVALLS